MKLKNTAQNSAVIIIILLLSMLVGYVYHVIGNRMDIASHPREYSEFVSEYAAEYGVPEYIIYGLILTGSDFQSNCVSEDGRIGLMQMSPETFQWMQSLTKENLDSGMLYDPDTNIRYGTYLLSYLYTEYNRWNTVIAIVLSDEETVKAWLENPACTDENGNLAEIPDPVLAEKAAQAEKEYNMYRALYYDMQ